MGVIEELNDRIDNKIPALINRAIQPSFTWETVVGYLQHCADNEVGEPVSILSYKLPAADQIDSIRPVREYLNEHLNVEVLGADLYTSFTTKSDSKYASKTDVLIWNVIGHSEFTINDNQRLVEPGDLIYIPAGSDYVFKATQSRAYVVFGIQR
jgi:hypothetical protein